jgi:hypothetical protein
MATRGHVPDTAPTRAERGSIPECVPIPMIGPLAKLALRAVQWRQTVIALAPP